MRGRRGRCARSAMRPDPPAFVPPVGQLCTAPTEDAAAARQAQSIDNDGPIEEKRKKKTLKILRRNGPAQSESLAGLRGIARGVCDDAAALGAHAPSRRAAQRAERAHRRERQRDADGSLVKSPQEAGKTALLPATAAAPPAQNSADTRRWGRGTLLEPSCTMRLRPPGRSTVGESSYSLYYSPLPTAYQWITSGCRSWVSVFWRFHGDLPFL